MRNPLLCLILAGLTLLFLGCSTPYTLVYKDGSEVRTTGEPVYNERTGFYEFKDSDGVKHQVNKEEIRALREGE